MTQEQENAINELQRMKIDKSHTGSEYNAIMTAIKAIKDLDKMNSIALDLASENDDLIERLDKIRAEIEQLTSRYSISKERGGMGQVEWSDRLIKESEVLQIIDKYKTESDHKCHTCKHYMSGEYDGSCDSYICKGYSDWESDNCN